ncbi:peroxiredoxin [methane-oxidizing endosymbiont of Gigantopelta aegis]|uniref:peroxiredoxin n=1 Tax=methane-oxidizing endosymbiont of Gigantopelta aegis TaxID=2794938 RepID=UPI0018DDD562|nr:peroxiredoxin [methane-oxidizing endosymbiont of Gigantopelta aegis]
MQKLKTNQPAPYFKLTGSDTKVHTPDHYKGHWLILFFYPKDNTPGCTAEACHLRDSYDEIRKLNGIVLGINTDSVSSHQSFIQKRQLPFPLLSDPDGAVSRQYGCLFKLGPIRFCKRHSFIIAPDGKLAKIYRHVNPSHHAEEIIQFLQTQTIKQ